MKDIISIVKSFNLLFIVLIVAQLLLLIMTLIMLATSATSNVMPTSSAVTAILLILVCIPICLILYRSTVDKISKRVFNALFWNFSLLAISGILLYFIDIISFGNLAQVISYLPLIYVLIITYNEQKNEFTNILRWFIFSLSSIFIIFLTYFIIANAIRTNDYSINVIAYLFSTIADTVLIAFTTTLYLTNMPTKRRYIFAILSGYVILSFIGDASRLLGLLGITDSIVYSFYLYDSMFVFISAALLIFAISNVKITTIEEINKKLADTTIVVDDLIMQSPDAMCMCDDNGLIVKANNNFYKLFETSNEIINKFNIFKYKFNFDIDISNQLITAKKGDTLYLENVSLLSDDAKFLTIKLYPTYSTENKISNYIFIAEDITKRRKAENELQDAYDQMENRVNERTAELSILNTTLQKEIYEHKLDEERIKASLKEKEVLLKEIHHRVKNNMQIISSMLGLQSAFVNDSQVNDILKDSQNRIKSMALIHEKLYQSNNMANVDFNEYVNSLVNNLYNSYTINKDKILVNLKIDNVSLNIDLAIPLGLIINELVSNSLKHAFPNDKPGQIDIVIKSIDNNMFELMVKDNGIGISNKIDVNNTKTLGLNLVNALVNQLDGKLLIRNDDGAEFRIAFPN